MRKACPYCKLMMVPVYRFSKNKIEYLLKCDNCHYEEKPCMETIYVGCASDNASKLVKAIIGVTNASK